MRYPIPEYNLWLYWQLLTIYSVLCGLVGGPGLVSGGNFNENLAVFEQATRNSGRKIAGQNLANPTAYLTSTSKVSMMHLYDSFHQIK